MKTSKTVPVPRELFNGLCMAYHNWAVQEGVTDPETFATPAVWAAAHPEVEEFKVGDYELTPTDRDTNEFWAQLGFSIG